MSIELHILFLLIAGVTIIIFYDITVPSIENGIIQNVNRKQSCNEVTNT